MDANAKRLIRERVEQIGPKAAREELLGLMQEIAVYEAERGDPKERPHRLYLTLAFKTRGEAIEMAGSWRNHLDLVRLSVSEQLL